MKATLTDRFDQDIIRSTRGQGIECINLEANVPALSGPIVPWLTLMSRWWNEQRGKIVESSTVDKVFDNPQQDYTKELLNAIPGANLKLGV